MVFGLLIFQVGNENIYYISFLVVCLIKKSNGIYYHKIMDSITLLEQINQWNCGNNKPINSHKSISDKSWDHSCVCKRLSMSNYDKRLSREVRLILIWKNYLDSIVI